MKRRKGFTLIEILIVVIILAVLAAMVLPRFLSQAENAYIAEAQQMLGALRRAETNWCDMTGCGTTFLVKAVTDTSVDANMTDLGLKGIPATNFSYSCANTGACTALRGGAATNGSIVLSMAGGFTCTQKYTNVSTDASKGCKPSA